MPLVSGADEEDVIKTLPGQRYLVKRLFIVSNDVRNSNNNGEQIIMVIKSKTTIE